MKAVPLVLAVGLLALSAGRGSAQVDFSGTWTLDRDISADLTKASLEPQPHMVTDYAISKTHDVVFTCVLVPPPNKWRCVSGSTSRAAGARTFPSCA